MDKVEIGYAFETINVGLQGGGVSKDVAEKLINEKIHNEGWTSVKTEVVHKNMAGEALTSVVVMYTLQRVVEDAPKAKK